MYLLAKLVFKNIAGKWNLKRKSIVSEREPGGSGVSRGKPPPPDPVDTEDEPETDDAGSTSGKAASPANPLLQERSNCEELRHVVCHLETKELWDKFNKLGTEMIITKTGRWVQTKSFPNCFIPSRFFFYHRNKLIFFFAKNGKNVALGSLLQVTYRYR